MTHDLSAWDTLREKAGRASLALGTRFFCELFENVRSTVSTPPRSSPKSNAEKLLPEMFEKSKVR